MTLLLERSRELDVLRAAIQDARGGAGRVVVIEGPAGIGKTALLARAREAAFDAGLDVLSARGLELEHEFAFGVARQLFELPVARAGAQRRKQLLAGAAGLTRPLLSGERRREERAGESPARSSRPASDIAFTISHGFYWLTANLAETEPLLLAVDDAQFADRSSLQCIAYLAARCQELPVLLALTLRTDESSADDELLASLRAAAETTIVKPPALSSDGVAQVIRERLGDDVDPKFCDACASATGGNPFLLGELLTELASTQIPPTAANASRVEQANPDSVRRVVLNRLGRLGPDAAALARAVAILEHASLRDAGDLARLQSAAAVAAADELLAAGILTAEPLAFVHPLLRVAVYEEIPPAQRADDHRRAALMLAAGPSTLGVGAHLLRASPSGDSQVVALLRQLATSAFAGGDLNAALALLRRALAEPPSPEDRGALLGQLGQIEALAHDPAAVEHLTAALAVTENPAARVATAAALGEVLVWGGGHSVRAYEMLTRVLDELGPELEPTLRATLETLRMATASVDVRLAPRVAEHREDLRELADAAGPAGRGLKIFDACWSIQTDGPSSGSLERLDDGLDSGLFVAEHTGGSPIVIYAALVLVLSDEVDRAEGLLADIRGDARSRGSIVSHLVDLAWGAFLHLRRGELRTAISDAEAALALARRLEASWVEIWMVACLCEALLAHAEIDEARELIESVALERSIGTAAALHAVLARARVRLATGDRESALADLWLAGENTIINNPSFLPWRPELAAILAPTDPHRAQELAEAAVARANELGQPRGIGIALRAQGRVLGGSEGIKLLSESVAVLRDSPARLELAQSLLALGGALRRSGQRAAARQPLREALALAQRCEARTLAELAQEELVVSGAKPRRQVFAGPQSLTPSEWRVAELAAAGMQNREIAQALFVTTKTVGTHLAHIYQKLDLSGQHAREMLAERLQADATGA